MVPKVFISYSWTNQQHQELVREWADRLASDDGGIEPIIDVYDLKEGNDLNSFMETMVTDPDVNHVLVICDQRYTERANKRDKGVGVEAQIISSELYNKVKQTKFIPIVTEFDQEGNAYLPVFMKSLKYIDFSSFEAVNNNWETLIRLIFNKPLYVKPKIGKPPAYITDDVPTQTNLATTKFNILKKAILDDKKGITIYRNDFLNACIEYADIMRTRQRPNIEEFGKKVIEDCAKLKVIRNNIVDWVILESAVSPSEGFSHELLMLLEKLLDLKSRPPEITQWNDSWFEAHTLFVYETFLYIVAALLKNSAYTILHDVFDSHYLQSNTQGSAIGYKFATFDRFLGRAEVITAELTPPGKTLNSSIAELLKIQADRIDLPFQSIFEADLLILLMSALTPNTFWHTHSLYYASFHHEYPIFIRATQHKWFLNLVRITGIESPDKLRDLTKAGLTRLGLNHSSNFALRQSFWESMNMDHLDTIK